uniref:Tn3 transposase DDE domain-containing protein n=1 Tax=Legionella sainthelensi TaxID=28087 RepID=A0A2H5FGF3_9GAMM
MSSLLKALNYILSKNIKNLYLTVFSSAERDAIYVIDSLLYNEAITSNFHSTDTHGYIEMVFAVSHLINFTFAPRIKKILLPTNLVSFGRIKAELESKNYAVKPTCICQ